MSSASRPKIAGASGLIVSGNCVGVFSHGLSIQTLHSRDAIATVLQNDYWSLKVASDWTRWKPADDLYSFSQSKPNKCSDQLSATWQGLIIIHLLSCLVSPGAITKTIGITRNLETSRRKRCTPLKRPARILLVNVWPIVTRINYNVKAHD